MFSLAILIGIYSYIIFFLGVLGLLNKPILGTISVFYFFVPLFFLRKRVSIKFKKKDLLKLIKKGMLVRLLLILLIGQAAVNFIGALGPETSFDALWYHLTLPKLYILQNGIFHIPGNLLFYSDMPKLIEMLYIPSLMLGGEETVKLIHFTFGILSLIVIYNISRKFLSKTFSIIAMLIFYSNLVVGWESITAYIDLARTFFETMALWGFLNWAENKQRKWLVISAVMLGFAIASKIIALESLIIFLVLFVYLHIIESGKLTNLLKNLLTFTTFSILVSLPWLVFSLLNTGNLFYPFFDRRINIGTSFALPSFSNFISDLINLFIYSNDPISPVYLITLPLLFFGFFKLIKNIKAVYVYSLLALIAWYITPRIGGGRFILPYLAAFSIIASYAIYTLKEKRVKTLMIVVVIFIAFTSLGYRSIANKKYIPVLLGTQTKSEYLTNRLNFSFGDFYDTDNYFKDNINPEDRVLLYGFHNLYYVDFPFIDSSWVKKGDKFNYIAIQKSVLPERFNNWQQIYYNPITKVKLYSLGGQQWAY